MSSGDATSPADSVTSLNQTRMLPLSASRQRPKKSPSDQAISIETKAASKTASNSSHHPATRQHHSIDGSLPQITGRAATHGKAPAGVARCPAKDVRVEGRRSSGVRRPPHPAAPCKTNMYPLTSLTSVLNQNSDPLNTGTPSFMGPRRGATAWRDIGQITQCYECSQTASRYTSTPCPPKETQQSPTAACN